MKKLIVIILLFTATIHLAKAEGNDKIDSLLHLLKNNNVYKSDTSKVDLLIDIGFEYLGFAPDSSLSYSMQALNLSTELKYEKGIARSNNGIAIYYAIKSDYPRALEYFLAALKMFESLHDFNGEAKALANIGNIYRFKASYQDALKYYLKAVKIYEQAGKKSNIPTILSNIATTHYELLNYPEALRYNFMALEMNKSTGNTRLDAHLFCNIGNVYSDQSDFKKGLEYYYKAKSMSEESGEIQLTSLVLGNIARTYFLIVKDNLKIEIQEPFSGNNKLILQESKSKTLKAIQIAEELGDLTLMKDNYLQLSELYIYEGDCTNSLDYFKKYTTMKDSIFNQEKDKKLTQAAMQYEFDKQQDSLKAEQEKKDIRQKNIRNSISAGLVGALFFLTVVYRQRNKIKAGKKRSDELLLNILPEEVAEELKAKGSAEAKQFDQVTVMFTDFKGFTQISEKLTPSELVAEIHTFFKAFDNIIGKYAIEKIKTIGDAYMCAGGLPVANNTNAVDVVNAALEIQQFMQAHLLERKKAGKDVFEIRIGIHSGPVVAGIVGVKKFAYDIWGDTVNIASRMESSGEPGKVNISGSTYELVKEQFNCIHRGKIAAKNKGEIDMYFVESV